MDENEALAREHELYCLSGKPKLFQDGFNKGFHEGWQAAKADSAKELAELESELIDKCVQAIINVGGKRVWEFADAIRYLGKNNY